MWGEVSVTSRMAKILEPVLFQCIVSGARAHGPEVRRGMLRDVKTCTSVLNVELTSFVSQLEIPITVNTFEFFDPTACGSSKSIPKRDQRDLLRPAHVRASHCFQM
jgi:hypothetical protein